MRVFAYPRGPARSRRLEATDKFLILGSDGVWDRISSQEAVDIAWKVTGGRAALADAASERIAQVARERWRQQGPMADDITAVVVALS